MLALVGALVIRFGGTKHNQTQKFMAAALLVLAIGMCYVFVYQIPAFQTAYFLDWILTTASLLSVPMFYVYLCHLTDTGSKMSRTVYFIPALIISMANMIMYVMMVMTEPGNISGR